MVGDGYLNTMRTSLRAGRDFTPDDDASSEPVILVNETLARTLWPGEDPLGRSITTSGGERRVVGVVRGVRYFGPEQESGAEMYLPIRQTASYFSVDLAIRATRPLSDLAPAVRDVLRNVDPNLPATEFRTLPQLLDRALFARRSMVLLIGGFAAFALILAALGIYGVVSYSVGRRKQEIGIRMALGATAGSVRARVLAQTLRLVLIGIALGAAASWAAGQALEGLLFGVRFSDPLTFAAVLLLLSAVAVLAGYLPASRASRLDPSAALRAE